MDVLLSTYADDPDMEELISEFVGHLSERVQSIRSAAQSDDRQQLRRLAHQLKGAAGGYGFMQVSEDAAALEAAVRDSAAAEEMDAALQRLENTCNRVRVTLRNTYNAG